MDALKAPSDLIGDTWITPTDIFYCRHHHPVPDIDTDEYTLKVSGKGVDRELSLSVDNLKMLFPKRELVVTTQCGGNRRSGMNRLVPPLPSLPPISFQAAAPTQLAALLTDGLYSTTHTYLKPYGTRLGGCVLRVATYVASRRPWASAGAWGPSRRPGGVACGCGTC